MPLASKPPASASARQNASSWARVPLFISVTPTRTRGLVRTKIPLEEWAQSIAPHCAKGSRWSAAAACQRAADLFRTPRQRLLALEDQFLRLLRILRPRIGDLEGVVVLEGDRE